ncbi:MAG: glycosyltransferase [Planctomycetota bacterium]
MEQNKLLLIINHMDWFWSHRLPLAQGAKEAGWDVHVCAGAASNNEKLEKNGYSGVGLPRNPLAIIFQLWRILGREKPAMVHVITLKYAFMAGLASRFYPKLRIVHTIAGLGYLFSGQGFLPVFLRFLVGPFLKFALRHPRARIIFQNPDDQALMIEQGFVRSSQVHLIRGSGVDLNVLGWNARILALSSKPDRRGFGK